MRAPSRMSRHDVVVVGARAAGGGLALLLARLGHDVAVVDRASLPSDTVSTHQLSRTGVVQLRRWGLLDAVIASGAPAIRQVSITTGLETVTRAVKDKAGADHLLAPRRYVLDTIVTEAARRAGARVRLGVTVRGVRVDAGGRVTGIYGHDGAGAPVEIEARFVVGADGLRSQVARSVGAAVQEDRGDQGATQYAYYAGLPWPGIEFFVGERSYAGVFPTHDGEACIWVCTPSAEAHAVRRASACREAAFAELLRRGAPALAARLADARRTSPVQGMLRTPNLIRHAHGPGWALVGDAGYHRDAVSGHGISDAYRDAELLADALDEALRSRSEAAALAGFQRQRDAALRELFEITCAMAAYPSVERFVAHTRELGAAIDAQAAVLASRPVPGERHSSTRSAPAGALLTSAHPRSPHRRVTVNTSTISDPVRNGVDTATLFATLDAVKTAPQAAKFQFRAANEWINGTHSRSTIDGFFGVGEERSHERTFRFDADHPAVLVGRDNGPTPVEYVLHALAACLTAGLANIAAARGVRLTEVRSTVSGDIDLNGILGLDPSVRNGYERIAVRFTVKGDAPAEKLREIVEQSRARSAVYDIITGQVPVSVEVEVA